VEWVVTTGKIVREFKGYDNKDQRIMRMDSILDRWILLGDGANIKIWDITKDSEEVPTILWEEGKRVRCSPHPPLK